MCIMIWKQKSSNDKHTEQEKVHSTYFTVFSSLPLPLLLIKTHLLFGTEEYKITTNRSAIFYP